MEWEQQVVKSADQKSSVLSIRISVEHVIRRCDDIVGGIDYAIRRRHRHNYVLCTAVHT